MLIAHTPASTGFVNHELGLCGRTDLPEPRWIDTLAMPARNSRMYNSLDALCSASRSPAERDKHGALIDCKLLAQVYLELFGGRERGLDLTLGRGEDGVSRWRERGRLWRKAAPAGAEIHRRRASDPRGVCSQDAERQGDLV